jgi:2-dehydro-3-deoxyphosphogluconate aldolase/(4S)-4-hydroxy-2-oxoglutarate aldolase
MNPVIEALSLAGIVPVVVIDDADRAAALGAALAEGGLPSAEVTLRTPQALDAIRILAAVPGFCVGAGTVVDPAQVEQALAAGAQYAVSPGFSASVSRECAAQGLPLIPGVVTPGEIQAALEAGHRVVKFFPAGASGGAPMLAALSAPFPGLRFMPTGGIDESTVGDYLRMPSVLAVGGTWIAPRAVIADGNFSVVTANARNALAIVEETR